MSQTLQIAGEIFWFTIILGFAIWLFIRSLKRSENPAKLIFKWVFTAIVVGFVVGVVVPGFREGGPDALHALLLMLICGLAMVVTWRHSLIDIIAKPLTSAIDGGNEPPESEPYYSIALAKRKLNKPLEAIAEVRKQLNRFPNDFEGLLLLAGIQAEDLKDLPGAESTLNLFCDSPAASPREVAAAMNHLADWHLKLAQNAEAARAALEKVIRRYPETELSLQAAQRIAHLDGAEKIFLAARDRQPMAMPEGVKNLGLLESSAHLFPSGDDPKKLAADYVKHLEQHPLDLEIREKLAILYADHYQRLDLATGELKQLIEYPNQAARRVARWLNLLANLQIRHGADYDTVRRTLEIIVERFPDSAVAELARTRLGRLKLELKGQKETPGVKLGVYEQNLGLKSGSPRQG
jgi:tetratricopeptide (TPR) repeat protein